MEKQHQLQRLMRSIEVLALLGISKPTLWRCIKRGEVPPPMKLGRSAFWSEDDIRSVLTRMSATRHNAPSDPHRL
jgi:predicted DNA-binding transcriptional regulator AlpA